MTVPVIELLPSISNLSSKSVVLVEIFEALVETSVWFVVICVLSAAVIIAPEPTLLIKSNFVPSVAISRPSIFPPTDISPLMYRSFHFALDAPRSMILDINVLGRT